jgi:uncharacterized protein YhbP (UPF0306 family)
MRFLVILTHRLLSQKIPFALAKPGDVWCIQLEMIKMTDNTQVFGKKLMWNKAELV